MAILTITLHVRVQGSSRVAKNAMQSEGRQVRSPAYEIHCLRVQLRKDLGFGGHESRSPPWKECVLGKSSLSKETATRLQVSGNVSDLLGLPFRLRITEKVSTHNDRFSGTIPNQTAKNIAKSARLETAIYSHARVMHDENSSAG